MRSILPAAVCLSTGVVSAYACKVMNWMQAPRCATCEPTSFTGAMLQTFFMFVAESLCLLLFFADTRRPRKRQANCKEDLESFLLAKQQGRWQDWVFPAMCDLVGTTLGNVALILTYASTVQMLRNSLVVCCAAIVKPDQSTPMADDPYAGFLGCVLALVGTAISSIQIMFEERLFLRTRYPPLKAIGIEGISGGFVMLFLCLPIGYCLNVENSPNAMYQIIHSLPLTFITIAYVLSGCLFNATGISITKSNGGLLRSILFAVRAPIIWGLDLALGWLSFDYFNGFATLVFLISFSLYSTSQ